MALNVVENRQLLYIISMFLMVQFAGLLLASQIFAGASFIPALNPQQSPYSTGGIAYLIFVVAAIAIFSIILVLLFRFVKTDKLFTLLEIWVVGAASLIFFLVLIAALNGSALSMSSSGAGPLGASPGRSPARRLLLAAKLKWPRLAMSRL